MKLRALIIDDEAPARAKIRKFLAERPEVQILGEAGDGEEAIEKILALKPQVVFLDIQMPKGDGFDVLREIWADHQPLVIFTTAYDEHAIRAFEVEALDYLLKPFTFERFSTALDRALQREQSHRPNLEKMDRVLATLTTVAGRMPRILIRASGRLYFIKAMDVEWVEAEEKYCLLHTRSGHHLVRESISSLETRLGPASFIRIHRSFLINLEDLHEVLPFSHGDSIAVLKSGARVKVGRQYRDGLLRAMGAGPGVSASS